MTVDWTCRLCRRRSAYPGPEQLQESGQFCRVAAGPATDRVVLVQASVAHGAATEALMAECLRWGLGGHRGDSGFRDPPRPRTVT